MISYIQEDVIKNEGEINKTRILILYFIIPSTRDPADKAQCLSSSDALENVTRSFVVFIIRIAGSDGLSH